MARPERYFIGPGARDKLHNVIAVVDGTPAGSGSSTIQTRLQNMPQPLGLRFYRGTFTGSWDVGQTRQIATEGSTNTVSVTNYCVGVTQSTSQTATLNVIFGNVQGTVSVVEIQPHRETSTCVMTLAGVDLTQLPGYSAGTIQLLGHSAADVTSEEPTACATLTWYSITTCTST